MAQKKSYRIPEVMQPCVINFADSAKCYYEGQDRLLESLTEHGYKGSVCAWTHHSQLGCPPHSEVPYAFKPYSLKWAYDQGYELVLWCDASVWAIKPIDPVFDYLENHSHLFFHNTLIGPWTSDVCLAGFEVIRDQAMKMPMLMGICMGFNLRHSATQEFLRLWYEKAHDGFSFPGAWTNDNHEVSDDPRCSGHRHDQSVASLLACKLGMDYIIPHQTFFSYWNPDMIDSVVLAAQGLPECPDTTAWRIERKKVWKT